MGARRPEDFPEPEVDLDEDLWGVIELYALYSSQWRPEFMGLDFTVFHHALDRMGLAPDSYDQWIADLRTIEGAARVHLTKPA